MNEIKKTKILKLLKKMAIHSKNITYLMTDAAGRDRGKRIAEEMNNFEMVIKLFMHGECGMTAGAVDKFFEIKTNKETK